MESESEEFRDNVKEVYVHNKDVSSKGELGKPGMGCAEERIRSS